MSKMLYGKTFWRIRTNKGVILTIIHCIRPKQELFHHFKEGETRDILSFGQTRQEFGQMEQGGSRF